MDHMMFRHDPYVRQERHRAEQEERERVLRLIEGQLRPLRSGHVEPKAKDPSQAVIAALAELRHAVRQGHQR